MFLLRHSVGLVLQHLQCRDKLPPRIPRLDDLVDPTFFGSLVGVRESRLEFLDLLGAKSLRVVRRRQLAPILEDRYRWVEMGGIPKSREAA